MIVWPFWFLSRNSQSYVWGLLVVVGGPPNFKAVTESGLLRSGSRCEMTLSHSKVTVGHSSIHDLGCFATKSMAAGEIAEHIPVLPLLWKDVHHQVLRDYVFASEIIHGTNTPYVVLPLGFGALYNHSKQPNVCLYRYDMWPFLQAVVCQEDVEVGDELLLNYGDAYWEAPWRDPPESPRDFYWTCSAKVQRIFWNSAAFSCDHVSVWGFVGFVG